YITDYDEEEEMQYITYDGSEEASAQEIFLAIYQQLSPSRRKQLAQLEYINVKLCNECLIPCDSDTCEDSHEHDADFDLRYPGEEAILVYPHQIIMIDLYLAIEVPVGTVCQLMSRSSLAKKGIEVKGGTIDAGYTGNIGVLLHNNSNEPYEIQPNERIAQAIFLQLAPIEGMTSVDTREGLGESSHGTQGFGSTGKDEMEA
ncbi:12641_t:CDS:2, partial [Racocetra fulgida]